MTTSNARQMTSNPEIQAAALAAAVEDVAASYAGTETGHKLESLLNYMITKNFDGSYSFHLPKEDVQNRVLENAQSFVGLLSGQEAKLGTTQMSTFLDFIFCFYKDIKKKKKQKRKQQRKQRKKQRQRRRGGKFEADKEEEESDEEGGEEGHLNSEDVPENARNC